jgi:hypothetical protein
MCPTCKGKAIFPKTRQWYHLEDDHPNPVGIIVGTVELDSNLMYNRIVVGRLLAVALGHPLCKSRMERRCLDCTQKSANRLAFKRTLAGSMVHPSRITWCFMVNGMASGENREKHHVDKVDDIRALSITQWNKEKGFFDPESKPCKTLLLVFNRLA